MDTEDPAFPVLRPSQLAEAAAFGWEQSVNAGQLLFEAGEAAYQLFVVLEGEAEVVRDGEKEVVLGEPPRAVDQVRESSGMARPGLELGTPRFSGTSN